MQPKTEFYNNGKASEVYTVNDKGQKNGEYQSYYENGKLAMKCTYEHDQKNGPSKAYYKNGQLERKCMYKNDEYDGPYEEYEENGKLVKKGTYVNGKFVPEKKGLLGLKAKLAEAQTNTAPAKQSLIGKCFKMFRGNSER